MTREYFCGLPARGAMTEAQAQQHFEWHFNTLRSQNETSCLTWRHPQGRSKLDAVATLQMCRTHHSLESCFTGSASAASGKYSVALALMG